MELLFPVTKNDADKCGASYSPEENKSAIFPSRLRDLRKEKGVSQEAVARKLGVSKSTIGLYETGGTLPDAKTLFNFAKYYGVSSDYLLGLSNSKSADINIRAISDLLGISEGVISELVSMNSKKGFEKELKAINAFLISSVLFCKEAR